jgi:hypothetical protein
VQIRAVNSPNRLCALNQMKQYLTLFPPLRPLRETRGYFTPPWPPRQVRGVGHVTWGQLVEPYRVVEMGSARSPGGLVFSLLYIVVGGIDDSVTTCCNHTGIYVRGILLTSLPWVAMVDAEGLVKAARRSEALRSCLVSASSGG